MQDAPQTPLLTMADQVTSPGGTTAAARTALHTHGVHDGLSNGIHAAYARSMELGGGGAAATGPRPATPLAQAGPAPAL